MKNADYVIFMTTSGGRTWRYMRDKDGWKQMGPEGQLHRMTAEQFLNHLLPAVSGVKPVAVKIVYTPSTPKAKTGRKKQRV